MDQKKDSANEPKQVSPKAGFLLVLCTPILGGLDYVFLEYMTAFVSSIHLAFIRTIVCTLFYLLIHHIFEGKLRIDRKDLSLFLMAGGFGVGLYYVFEITGISMTSAALSSLILSMVPVITIFGDRLVFGHRITGLKAIGSILSVIGVGIIIAGSGDTEISGTILGILVLLCSTVFWAVFILASKPLNDKYSALTITTVEFIIGSIVLVPFFLFSSPQAVLSLTPMNWILIAAFGIICIAAADLSFMYGIGSLPVAIPSIVLNLLPFVTILASWIVFHSMLGPLQLFGGALIIFSVILTVIDGSGE